MYRLLIETLLGVNREGDQLRLEPRLPSAWDTCKIHYRFRETVYHITFTRLMSDSNDERSLFLDGQLMAGATLTLMDDRREHEVEMKVR
jgi:cellobiose phosphorylase